MMTRKGEGKQVCFNCLSSPYCKPLIVHLEGFDACTLQASMLPRCRLRYFLGASL